MGLGQIERNSLEGFSLMEYVVDFAFAITVVDVAVVGALPVCPLARCSSPKTCSRLLGIGAPSLALAIKPSITSMLE